MDDDVEGWLRRQEEAMRRELHSKWFESPESQGRANINPFTGKRLKNCPCGCQEPPQT